MAIENKAEFVSEVVSRVINNAPISEILRVYSLFVQEGISELSDEDLLEAVLKAGYTDLLEKYSVEDDLVSD